MITSTPPLLAVGNETTLQCQSDRQQIQLRPVAHVVFHAPASDNATDVGYAIRQNLPAVQVCLFSQVLADLNALQRDSNDCPFFLVASASYLLYLSARSMLAFAPGPTRQHFAIQAGYALVPCIPHATVDHLVPSVALHRAEKYDQMYTQQIVYYHRLDRKVQSAAGPGALVDEPRAQGVSRPETALLAQIRMWQLDLLDLRYRLGSQTISLSS